MASVATSTVGKLIGGSGDRLSVDTELQIGDKEIDTDVDTQIGGTRVQGTGEIIAKDHAVVVVDTKVSQAHVERTDSVTIQNIPPYVLILLILGWVLPDPWPTVRSWFKRERKD